LREDRRCSESFSRLCRRLRRSEREGNDEKRTPRRTACNVSKIQSHCRKVSALPSPNFFLLPSVRKELPLGRSCNILNSNFDAKRDRKRLKTATKRYNSEFFSLFFSPSSPLSPSTYLAEVPSSSPSVSQLFPLPIVHIAAAGTRPSRASGVDGLPIARFFPIAIDETVDLAKSIDDFALSSPPALPPPPFPASRRTFPSESNERCRGGKGGRGPRGVSEG
jgi:hypothetical protein